MTQTVSTAAPLAELAREARMGDIGTENVHREVRRIDLSDFENRKAEITEALWSAATDIGFFQVCNHGITQTRVEETFAATERFFAQPDAVKAQWPLRRNAGWESKSQVRPSTRTVDQKESYQITRPRMQGLWPTEEELPGFQATLLAFEADCWQLGMRILSCFADKLGFAPDFFRQAHEPTSPQYQSTLRLLHYFAMPPAAQPAQTPQWRASAHTDFDTLTLLFQKQGQGGLQLLPGKDIESGAWTSVEPDEGVITCNIGDMLMRWSDDVLPSNFHRVRMPREGEYAGARYSLAFFCQANEDAIIEGPGKKYPPITGGDYLRERIAANY